MLQLRLDLEASGKAMRKKSSAAYNTFVNGEMEGPLCATLCIRFQQ